MFKQKVIQLDISAGQTPKIDAVRQRVKWLKRYGLTGMLLYMESMIETDTFPCARADKKPITKQFLRELNDCCRQEGVTLIPLMQTLGHQGDLLMLKKFQHLGEYALTDAHIGGNNFLPWSDEARRRVTAWLDELIPLFEGPLVHLGCDEVWSLGNGRSREIIQKQGAENVLADYLSFLNDFIKSRGKRMMMYADLLVDYPKLLPLLPKDIMLVNWHYGPMDGCAEADNHHMASHGYLHSCGHTVWGSNCDMAGVGLIPFLHLEKNLNTWLDLSRDNGDEGFVVSYWFERTSNLFEILGDQYCLMKLDRPSLSIEEFFQQFSQDVLGEVNWCFVLGMSQLMRGNTSPKYLGERLIQNDLSSIPLMVKDPSVMDFFSRRFGSVTKEQVEGLLAEMRSAEDKLNCVSVENPTHPEMLQGCRMIANRGVMMALRARLWYEYVWDTCFPAPIPERDRPRQAWLREYLDRSAKDLEWARNSALKENDESEIGLVTNKLEAARKAIPRLFPFLNVNV